MRYEPTGAEVQTLVLSASGWLLQWRSDGRWRELSDAQHESEVDGSQQPLEDEWVRWSGTFDRQAKGGARWDGVATWWLLYGELPEDSTPIVVLADGQRPAVLQVGKVWACEWVSIAQPATLHLAGEQITFPFTEPFYRRDLG
ncbi:hypothetical protein GCM10020358_49300 [Amorphoplanes nipponensis]|uniref:hypothetical protein n=1 Tax=Actinoplanes nipponensis TaxID=135950 RepID=UPI001944B873|nr:hypothetical protein [Actinoplanes nipponensis]